MNRPLVCLFVGPTVPADDIRCAFGRVEAEFLLLPPVQQGDVLRLIERSPDVIGIVDGAFFHVPSVMHREILLALESGIHVLGASSMGALRAAELDRFGMEGIGRIYRMYRRGQLEGDDEVAVLHAGGDLGYRPLTEALVNVRHNLRRARRRGIISAGAADAVLASARRLHFTERTYDAILDLTRNGPATAAELAALRRFLQFQPVDLKREDALALTHALVRRIRGAEPWPPRQPVCVVRTTHFSRYLDEYIGRPVAGQHVPDELVVSFQRLLSPAAPEFCRRVARRCLAVDEAIQRGLPRQDSEVLVERWRGAHDLKRDALFQAWLNERCLLADELALALGDRDLEERLLVVYAALYPALTGPSELFARIEQDVARRVGTRAEALMKPLWMRPGILWSRPLARELKIRAEFRPALALVGQILQHNVAFFEANPCYRLSRIRRGLVSEFFAHRWAIRESRLEEAILERGFVGYGQFLEPAARVFIYERTRNAQSSHEDPSYWFHTDG